MKSRILMLVVVTGLLLLGSTVLAQAELSAADKQQIADNLDRLVSATNRGDTETLVSLISPLNPDLQAEVEERVGNDIFYELHYSPLDRNIKLLGTGGARVKARFSASGPNWSTTGFSTYFVFEKQDEQWLITDTDFHRKLGADFVSAAFKGIVYVGVPIVLLILVLISRRYVNRKNALGDRSLWFLLLANGITILLAIAQNWDLSTLLWIYWSQSVTIGVFNFIRMLELGEPKPALFFLLHYGFFHLGYLVFLAAGGWGEAEGNGSSTAETMYILPAALLFLANHLYSYIHNRRKDSTRQNVAALMFYPYARIIPMHLTIVLGAGSGGDLLFFLVLKACADAVMHVIEHAVLRRAREPQNAHSAASRAES